MEQSHSMTNATHCSVLVLRGFVRAGGLLCAITMLFGSRPLTAVEIGSTCGWDRNCRTAQFTEILQ